MPHGVRAHRKLDIKRFLALHKIVPLSVATSTCERVFVSASLRSHAFSPMHIPELPSPVSIDQAPSFFLCGDIAIVRLSASHGDIYVRRLARITRLPITAGRAAVHDAAFRSIPEHCHAVSALVRALAERCRRQILFPLRRGTCRGSCRPRVTQGGTLRPRAPQCKGPSLCMAQLRARHCPLCRQSHIS